MPISVPFDYYCFHSINVPSEWGQIVGEELISEALACFHSINVPSEWGQQNKGVCKRKSNSSFHSINVPSEWGPCGILIPGGILQFPFN